MSKRTKLVSIDLHELKVSAPESLNLSGDASRDEIVRWRDAATIFIEAMADLERIVVVNYIRDEDLYYLASIEEEVPRVP